MSKDQIKQILSMGYRGANIGITNKMWLKPFGYLMFRIHELGHDVIMDIVFKDSKPNEYGVWERSAFSNSTFNINDIKDFENNLFSQPFLFESSEFHFLSMKEIFENDLVKKTKNYGMVSSR